MAVLLAAVMRAAQTLNVVAPLDFVQASRLAVSDPQLAALAQTFFTTADPQVCIATMGDIADLTIQTRLFFDMESSLQYV